MVGSSNDEGLLPDALRARSFKAGTVLIPLLFLGLFFFYPLGSIFSLAGSAALEEGVNPDFWLKVWRSLRFTIWQASLSTLLTLAVGLPAAYLFARFTFPGKSILRVLSTIPFILPTVVVAASFNALVGPRADLRRDVAREKLGQCRRESAHAP